MISGGLRIPQGFGGWPPPFLPTDIGSCVLWLPPDPAAMTFNGADVVTWWDQSGNGRDVTQGVAANQPLYSAAGGPLGGPAIVFDGVTEYLQGAWAQSEPLHTFIRAIPDRTNLGNNLYVTDGIAPGVQFIRVINGLTGVEGMGPSGLPLSVLCPQDAWHTLEFLYNGAASTFTVVGYAPAAANAGTGDVKGLTLGCYSGISNHAPCTIAEVVQYSAEVTGADLTALEAYLAGH